MMLAITAAPLGDISGWQALALGPLGGAVMFGILVGGIAALKFVAPKIYQPKIDALEERVSSLEEEVSPYREWKETMASDAMNARKHD